LVEWRERKATTERRPAFADHEYWGRPVPSLGGLGASILVVGLAPAAHGGNRTGRMFTGDRSGEWLFRALHRAGLATSADDEDPDLALVDTRVTAVCHCAPPENKPLSVEVDTCTGTWLIPEMEAMRAKVIVCLGGLAWNRVLRLGRAHLAWEVPTPRPRFGHGTEVPIRGGPLVIGSYHPSQQNTFTGRLTEAMFDRIWSRAAEAARCGP
jgi:uracil-DNA glycosylase family 4